MGSEKVSVPLQLLFFASGAGKALWRWCWMPIQIGAGLSGQLIKTFLPSLPNSEHFNLFNSPRKSKIKSGQSHIVTQLQWSPRKTSAPSLVSKNFGNVRNTQMQNLQRIIQKLKWWGFFFPPWRCFFKADWICNYFKILVVFQNLGFDKNKMK